MKKIGLLMPELIDVTHSENVSVSFIDVEKLTYMQGNVERKFDSYFYKDNEKFTINPVSVVLPLNNGEIHEFGKTEINFASFCD